MYRVAVLGCRLGITESFDSLKGRLETQKGAVESKSSRKVTDEGTFQFAASKQGEGNTLILCKIRSC